VFIWHCADDDCVPVENSLKFISALSEKGILYEAHIFPKGGHGLSLADESTAKNSGQIVREVQQWTDLAADFIKRL
jgi:dipeptidyl aminopeptidase/acylaminoacyl peptidase